MTDVIFIYLEDEKKVQISEKCLNLDFKIDTTTRLESTVIHQHYDNSCIMKLYYLRQRYSAIHLSELFVIIVLTLLNNYIYTTSKVMMIIS